MTKAEARSPEGRDVHEVGDPGLIPTRRREVAIDESGRPIRRRVGDRGPKRPAAHDARSPSLL